MASQDKPGGIAGLAPFTVVTVLLAVLCGVLAYLGTGRQAPVNQRTVEGPQQEPTAAQVAKAAQAQGEAGALSERLRVLLASLDPLQCPPGRQLDQAKYDALKQANAGKITAWRQLVDADTPKP